VTARDAPEHFGIQSIRGRVVIVDAGSPVLHDSVVELHHGRIAAVRPGQETDSGPVYDVVMPGLIDAHSHARAIPIPDHGIRGGPLERFLLMLSAMTPLDPYDEALAAADAGLAAGITTTQVIHHSHGSTQECEQHLQAIISGYDDAGVRAAITLGFTDRDEFAPLSLMTGMPVRLPQLAKPRRGMTASEFASLADRWMREYCRDGGPRQRVVVDGVGPVAPQWCSAETNAAIGSARHGGRVHAHLLESPWQAVAARTCDPVQALIDAELLGPWSVFAHGVQLGALDRDRLARAGATVAHNPGSNHNLNAGRARVRRLLDDGVSVALGIDSNGASAEPDMFGEMRAALTAAEDLGEPLTAREVLAMATSGGARALSRPDLGVLTEGAGADVIAVALADVADASDPVAELVRRADRGSVAARWIAGQPVTPSGATEARRRMARCMEQDAAARAARINMTAGQWRRVHDTWATFQARTAAS
jgi:5-methylthioadenosine/S-adenosylhomocysteine deaminase